MAEALRVGKLRRARLLAGRQGLSRIIEHVDVIEMPDIRPWVKPNILYLTSFYAIRDQPGAQQDLIRYLAAHGAAGLVLDTQSFLRGAPPEVLAAADSSHFPVIELPEDASYIDIITPVMEAVFSRRRVREEFLQDLLQGKLDPEVMRQRAGYLGWQPGGRHTVVIADLDDFESFCLSGRLTEQAIQELKKYFLAAVEETTRRTLPGQHLVGARSDSAVMVVELPPEVTPGPLPGDASGDGRPGPLPPRARSVIDHLARKVKEAAARVLPGITVSVGVGLLCSSPSQIASSFRAASNVLELTRAPGGHKGITRDRLAFYQDLGIYRLLLRLGTLPELERFVEEEIGALVAHDGSHRSQLVHTLEVYLDCGCRLEKAAARLYLHRNSLKYRLARIKQLLQIHALEGDRLSSLALAVKAHRILTQRQPTAPRGPRPAARR